MKKILSLVLSLAILFSFSACGFEKSVTDNQEASTNDGENDDKNGQIEKDTKKDERKKKNKKLSTGDLLKNIHVRKAIALSIDKEAIGSIIGSTAKPSDYLVPKDFCFNDKGEDFRGKYPDGFLKHNLEEGKKEWELAKKELNFETMDLEIMTFNGEDSGEIIQQIASDLEKNLDGISVRTNQQSLDAKSELTKEGQFYVDLQGWIPDYNDPLAFLDLFSENSAKNDGKYHNEEFQELIDEAKISTEFDKRFENLQKAEKIILEDVALIPLYQDSEVYLIRPYIRNLSRTELNTGFYFKYASNEKSLEGEKLISTLGGGDGAILDVNKATDQGTINLLLNINEGLLSFDEEGKVKGGLAESWDVSENKTEYIFHLRQSIWSNGEPVRAQDFVDSWQRLANSETKSEYTTMLETAGIKNAIEVIDGKLEADSLGVEAIDDYTLKVTLDRPVPYFIDLMAFTCFYPINKNFVNEQGEDYGTSIDSVLYNGPYKIRSWDLGYGLELVKNDSYWDLEHVMNDGVKYRMAKDLETGLAMYDNHDIDLCPLDNESAMQRKNSPDFVAYNVSSMFYLVINMDFKEK